MSCNQTVFCPLPFREAILPYVMCGDAEPTSKIHRMNDEATFIDPQGIFTRYLKIWASDLVCYGSGPRKTNEPCNTLTEVLSDSHEK